MKMMVKVLLTAAAIAALAAPALAAPGDVKLIVRNDADSANAFQVDNNGTILGAKLAMGTTVPQAPLHLNLPTALGVSVSAGTALYNVSTGFAMSTQDNSPALDLTAADGTGTAGFRGAIRGVRSRGTLAVPAAAALNDVVLSLLGGVYDGGAVRNTADISMMVDGAVSSTIAPQRISFRTKVGGGLVAFTEHLTIKNDGKILLNTTILPVYADNTAAASLAAGTIYRTATGTLMVKY